MTKALRSTLTAKLVARLSMRWPQAAAYVPTGSTTVHTSALLADADRAAFDSYVLGYQDAIEDVVRHMDGDSADPAPYALQRAENSPFQGGRTPPASPRRNRPRGEKPTGKLSSARRQLEELFSGGSQ